MQTETLTYEYKGYPSGFRLNIAADEFEKSCSRV